MKIVRDQTFAIGIAKRMEELQQRRNTLTAEQSDQMQAWAGVYPRNRWTILQTTKSKAAGIIQSIRIKLARFIAGNDWPEQY